MSKRKLLKYLLEHTSTFLPNKEDDGRVLVISVKNHEVIDELKKSFR